MKAKAVHVSWPCAAMCALFLLLANGAVAADPMGARLEHATLPAQGRQQTLLTVEAFGRYAVTVRSAQGVSLQALDRMAGLGPLSGEPGKQDGRLDFFLERGETRIVTRAADNAGGEARLEVRPFQELNARPPLLVEQRWERASLGDFQQRSYWLDITKETTVALEAAGRHLADLRLWRDGVWLLEEQPELERNRADPERPLTVARLVAKLTPGLYLLTAYGGPSLIWTEESAAQPFQLRWGVPGLAPALRQRFVMNELGVERFRVPAGPTYFRLELPEARDAHLQVGGYSPDAPFQNIGADAAVTKKSTPPVAEVNWNDTGERIVTVQAAPGKPYVLQHFQANQAFRIRQPGNYWMETVQAGSAGDTAGTTAVLTVTPDRGREAFLADRVLEFTPGKTWHRRFNLLGDLTLFVKLPARGRLGIADQGVKAQYRVEPFLTSRPANYRTPDWRDAGASFDLDAGLYVLTVHPVNKGILDLHLRGAEATESDSDWLAAAKQLLGMDAAPDKPAAAPVTPVTAAASFRELNVAPNYTYTLYLNRQPGVATGLILRTLPIDLGLALAVSQRAGETIAIPISIPEAGTLRAVAEDGKPVEIALSDGRRGAVLAVEPGRLEVTVQAGATPLNYALALEPARLASTTLLPSLPDTRLAQLPVFPVVVPDAPQGLALERRSAAVFSVRVDKPGLYRFESAGLLETVGKVRTRINPALYEAGANGVGRNFLIQHYLREGEYQLQVATQGETRGDLEVRVERTDPIDQGELRPGESARTRLGTGQALAYWLRVDQPGRYRLQAQGLGHNFALRLEDEDGWPLDLSNAAQPEAAQSEAAAPAPAEAAPARDPEVAGEGGEETPAEAGEREGDAAPVVEMVENGAGVVASGDVTLSLEPGRYRVLILPQSVEARVLAHFDRVPEVHRFEGHGPHKLVLGTPVQHTWREPEPGKPRISDHWLFSLPAEAEVGISLDAGMEANLLDGVDRKRRLDHLFPGKPWKGVLSAGSYLLRVRHSRGDNLVDYRLAVASRELLAGQRRDVSVPASLPVSVGRTGLAVFRSLGGSDVRARLLDAQGTVLAQNDDQTDGWNFEIAQRLKPGRYSLEVEPGGAQNAVTRADRRGRGAGVATTVAMAMPREILEPALPGTGSLDIKDGRVHVFPIAPPATANYLRVRAADASVAGLALEGRGDGGWMDLGSAVGRSARLFLPLAPESFKAYRLRAWVPDARGLPVRIAVAAGAIAPVDEAVWLRGEAGTTPLDAAEVGGFATAVRLARPGSFRIAGEGGTWQWTDSASRAAESGDDGVVTVNGELLWLLSERAGPAPAGERVRIPERGQSALRLSLAPGQASLIDPPAAGLVPTLVLADARGGQPGVSFGPDRPVAATGLAPGQAVAVALPGANAPVTVWNAGEHAPIEVDLSVAALRASPVQALEPGVRDAGLAAGEALPLALPAGNKEIALSLGADMAAVLVRNGQVVATHWSGGEALRELLSTDADRLWLLNASGGEARYGVEFLAGQAAPRPLGTGELRQHNLASSGRLRLSVDIPAGQAGAGLHVRGAERAWWQEAGGAIQAGTDFKPRGAGVLWLWHKPGPLVVWLDGPGGVAAAGLAPMPVTPPASLQLQGEAQLLALQAQGPVMLHVRSETALVSQFLLTGQAPRTDVHLQGASLNLPVPAGTARLLLRPLGAAVLAGKAALVATPAMPIGEGVGPELLLAPGDARLFGFELKQPAAVGIGVQASADVVRCALYDERGAALGEGVVQMPELRAGRYFLAIENPGDAAPVRVRPILLGSLAPDTRPPYEVLRRYVEADESAPSLIYVLTEKGQAPGSAGQEPDEPDPAGDAGSPASEE